MRKNILDIFIVIVFFFWAFGLYTYFSGTPEGKEKWTFQKEKKIQTYEEIEQIKQLQSEQDASYYNQAVESKNLISCQSISDISQKVRCEDIVRMSLALDTRDLTLCLALSSSGMTTRCEDTVHNTTALDKKDTLSCKNIADENIRSNCIETIEKDLYAIASASGTLSKDLCEGFQSGIRSSCMQTLMIKDDAVLYKDALANKSLTSCDIIADTTIKIQCRDTLIFQRAISENDVLLCRGITDSTKNEACRTSLGSREDTLRFQSLISSGSVTDCDTLSTDKYKNQCHDMILIRNIKKNGDISLCNELFATGMIDRCQKMGGK